MIAYPLARLSRYWVASSVVTRSAYLAPISNRFASWGSGAMSPQALETTIVMKPLLIESMQLARTQPDVVKPVNRIVSTCMAVSIAASDVPKNADGYCLVIMISSSRRSNGGCKSASGLSSSKQAKGGPSERIRHHPVHPSYTALR